jgi:hypothetical protein
LGVRLRGDRRLLRRSDVDALRVVGRPITKHVEGDAQDVPRRGHHRDLPAGPRGVDTLREPLER